MSSKECKTSSREKLFACDFCEKEKTRECNVVEQLKGIFKAFGQAYGIHGFFVITKCDRFTPIVENLSSETLKKSRCEECG